MALSFHPLASSEGDPQHLTSQNYISGVQSHPHWQRMAHQILWEAFLKTVSMSCATQTSASCLTLDTFLNVASLHNNLKASAEGDNSVRDGEVMLGKTSINH